MRIKAHITLLALAAMIRASAVHAQGVDAAAHLRRGVELRQQGHDDEARAEFQLAYDATHTPVAAGQLGFAEQALGQWLAAEAHVREAMGAGDDDWVRRNRAALESAYATIEQHVGQLEVRGEPAGAEVFVNGESAGTLPLAAPIHAVVGTVDLEVRAQGRYTEARRVAIAADGLARENVVLRRTPIDVPLAPDRSLFVHPSPPPQRARLRVGAITLIATGAVLGITGAVVGFWPVQQLSNGGDKGLYVAGVIAEYALFTLGAAAIGSGLWIQFGRTEATRGNRDSAPRFGVWPVASGALAMLVWNAP